MEGAGTSRAVESSPGIPSSTDVTRPASPSDAGLKATTRAMATAARAAVSTPIAPRVRARARSPGAAVLARALPASPSSSFGGRLIPASAPSRRRPASWGQRAPGRLPGPADEPTRRGDELTAGVKGGDDGAGYDSGDETKKKKKRTKSTRTKSQRAGAVGGKDRRGFDSVAGFMSIGGADVDPLSAFGVSSTDGALPAFKPTGYARPSLRRRSTKGSRVWKILTGVARPSSNAAASSDVDDENTAVMEDSMTAGGVLGGGVMGSGDFDRISMIPIGLSVDDLSMEDADEDPYFPFEESVKPAATLNGGGGNSNGVDGQNDGRKKKKKKGTVVSPPKPYKVMRINSNTASENPGAQVEQQLTRRALLRDAELTPRDLRRIDPSLLQTNNTPALLVNDQTILVNLGVRVIIRPDHALLFEPDTATARRFLAAVEQRQKNSQREQGLRVSDRSLAYDGGYRGIELENGHEISEGVGGSTDGGAAPSDYDLDKTPGGVGGAPIPFELEVVEAALQETTSQLYAKMEFCEERCRQVSKRLQSSINPAVLEELRLTKQSLVELDSRAGAVRQVLLDTLDDDDDVTDFTISSTAETEEEKEDEEEEVENLIEYYLQQTETVHSAAEQLLENTRDLEESISVSLSSRRYEVSKLELTLSIATFAAALGALITGIFGMNLRSCLEMSVTAFYLTCFLIFSGIGAIFQAIMRYARRQKIL